MDHGLCRQTVTVYHRAGNEICRQVAENCHYTWQEITPDRWATFLPVNVPGLSQVEYVKAWPEDGPLSHREAGRK